MEQKNPGYSPMVIRGLKIVTLLSLALLSACRMPVVVNGKGFVFGELALDIYKNGYVFEINENFEEKFWPIPAPGNSFKGWERICSRFDKAECHLKLGEELWSNDNEVPLEATFKKNYTGPLTLLDYGLYWYSPTRTLSIPADSLLLEGIDETDSPRLFLAPPSMKQILPGKRVGDDYEFQLPPNSPYRPEDFWLFVSATDAEGIVATVGYDFGVSERVSADSLRPYNAQSPWADTLVDCATASNPFSLCSMSELPYLGTEKTNPSVSDIMKRTVVSHAWMGLRFSQVLQQLPPELLKMFRGITAIVISSDIRPAFFTAVTGAIYLDPQDLWLTPAERQSIDWTPDYRTGFGNDLLFISASYYLEGDAPAWYFSSDYPEGVTRSIADIERPLAWLLSHELAHANDAVPPALLPLASSDESPIDIYYSRQSQSATATLDSTYPLYSELLKKVGGVLFHGEIADNEVLELTARHAGLEFQSDSANAMYAYSTPREDTASLVEEVLMSYFYGVDKLEAFMDVPPEQDPSCNDYIMRWGSVNRVSEPDIIERARLVLSSILDEADVSDYLNTVPPTTQLPTGVGFCTSLDALVAPGGVTPGMFLHPPETMLRELGRARHHVISHQRVTGPRPRSREINSP